MNDSEKNDKNRVFAYYRTSTDIQSIDMQKHSVKNYAEKNNMEIVEEFKDEGISGVVGFERPAFQRLYNRLKNVNNIHAVLVYAWDRISRDEEFAVMFMYYIKKIGVKIIETKSGMELDFRNMTHRLKTMFDSVFSQEERLRIKKRQIDGIKAYREEHNGEWGRRKSYGKSPFSHREMSEETFWRNYEIFRLETLLSKSAIARMFEISRATLYRRLEENGDKYEQIEREYAEKKGMG
jgi:DNA invertase Pin-like site-specific DNA recombinase